MKHPVAAPVYANLFGRWEGNWVGWNTAHDIRLPGSSAKGTLPFLMYPNGENASGAFDSCHRTPSACDFGEGNYGLMVVVGIGSDASERRCVALKALSELPIERTESALERRQSMPLRVLSRRLQQRACNRLRFVQIAGLTPQFRNFDSVFRAESDCALTLSARRRNAPARSFATQQRCTNVQHFNRCCNAL